MRVISFVWWLIFLVLSLTILVGCLWILRVMIDWWLDIDYVRKMKEWLDNDKHQ